MLGLILLSPIPPQSLYIQNGSASAVHVLPDFCFLTVLGEMDPAFRMPPNH